MSLAIVEVQLRWLAAEPDGLIIRKSGIEMAEEARHLADIALQEWLETGERGVRWQALDTFMRTDGHRRNPGTTADLIAAALFVFLCTDLPSTDQQ
jgi:triphosphoribosyl-dephospho-CoA synthase